MPNVETVLLSLEERTVITWKEFKEDFLEKVIAKAKDPTTNLEHPVMCSG